MVLVALMPACGGSGARVDSLPTNGNSVPTLAASVPVGLIGRVEDSSAGLLTVSDGEGRHEVVLSIKGLVRRASGKDLAIETSVVNIRSGDSVSVHGVRSGTTLIADLILVNFFAARPVAVLETRTDGFVGNMSLNRGEPPQRVVLLVSPSTTKNARTRQAVSVASIRIGSELTVESFKSDNGDFVAVSIAF